VYGPALLLTGVTGSEDCARSESIIAGGCDQYELIAITRRSHERARTREAYHGKGNPEIGHKLSTRVGI